MGHAYSFVVPTIQLLSYCMISPTLPFTHSLAITLLAMMLPNKLCFLCTCHRLAMQYTLFIVAYYVLSQFLVSCQSLQQNRPYVQQLLIVFHHIPTKTRYENFFSISKDLYESYVSVN